MFLICAGFLFNISSVFESNLPMIAVAVSAMTGGAVLVSSIGRCDKTPQEVQISASKPQEYSTKLIPSLVAQACIAILLALMLDGGLCANAASYL